MKASEIREQTDDELGTLVSDLERKLWKARFDNHTNQLDNTSTIGGIRKDLARVKTILTERASAKKA